MPPELRQKLLDCQRMIDRTLERNQQVLRTSTRESARYRRTLSVVGAEVRDAQRDLRRAGYLKK